MTPLFLGLPEVKSPWVPWLLLLVPVLLVIYIWASHRSRSTAMRFTNTAILGAVMSKQPQWKRHIAVAAALLCVATTTVAWARPMGIEQVPRNRATIVVAIDSSLSMKADDVSPTRLAAAKAKAKDFINSLPTGFNVAVVSISEHPEIRMPPSTDRPTVLRAVDGIELQDGTAWVAPSISLLKPSRWLPGGLKIRLRPPLSCSVTGIIPRVVLPWWRPTELPRPKSRCTPSPLVPRPGMSTLTGSERELHPIPNSYLLSPIVLTLNRGPPTRRTSSRRFISRCTPRWVMSR